MIKDTPEEIVTAAAIGDYIDYLEERIDKTEALLAEGRRLAGRSWSKGMGFNEPPSPRKWQTWMADVDAKFPKLLL